MFRPRKSQRERKLPKRKTDILQIEDAASAGGSILHVREDRKGDNGF